MSFDARSADRPLIGFDDPVVDEHLAGGPQRPPCHLLRAGRLLCAGTGYKGRIGLFEVMTLSEEIRSLVVERASADQIARLAVTQGLRRLRDDGLAKVRAGETSIAEVARVTGS